MTKKKRKYFPILSILGMVFVLSLGACTDEIVIDSNVNDDVDVSTDTTEDNTPDNDDTYEDDTGSDQDDTSGDDNTGDNDDNNDDTGDNNDDDDEKKEEEPGIITIVSITADPSSTVEVGESVSLYVETDPSDATIEYESSDKTVADVAANGVVTTYAAGETTITVTASKEGYTSAHDTITIIVNPVTQQEEPTPEPGDDDDDDDDDQGGDTGGDDQGGDTGGSTPDEPDEPDEHDEPDEPEILGEYALYGDFLDNYWNTTPDQDSVYYLSYTSETEAKWEVTVTMSSEDTENDSWAEWGPWEASFCIIEYGNEDNVIADYSNLDHENSSGVIGSDNNNHICVYWNDTYDLVIDMTNGTPVITVKDQVEHTEAYYALYGDFSDSSWVPNPSHESQYSLAYDIGDATTKYWTVTTTITADSGNDWNAGFRVIEYNDYETTIAGYTNLDSASTGVLGAGDDGNISVSWGATYEITIDCRLTVPSILVTLISYADTGDEGGDDTGDTGATEPNYDSCYVLYGDFAESSWDESPSEESVFYLKYDSSDPSTKYWIVTATISGEPIDDEWWGNPNTWYAGFRIIAYGDYSTTIADYSNLDSASTGTHGAGSDNNIAVSWNATYTITIDLRDTYSILVEEEGYEEPSYNYDAAYVITGDLTGADWSNHPTNEDYILPYETGVDESRYWERTITIATEPDFGEWDPWDAGFRIVEYSTEDDDWTEVAGYTSLASGSTGVENWTDDANNIKLVNGWGNSFDLVIDFTGGDMSILVTPSDTSSSGSGSSESGDMSFVSNFAMGMDFSSIEEVETAGGEFYDYDGNKTDVVSFLAENGVNYARIRLWNDPSDGTNSYCGGGNDLETDLKIAQRAVTAGMKICLDFHYSDFWAHHGQQYAPKEWQNYDASEKASAGADWTKSVLEEFAKVGCTPSMVQVGNETNNNEICGLSNSNGAIAFFKSCCDAVRSFDSNIQIVIHYADDQNAATYKTYYDALISGGCDFDICGLSFYPFWHEEGSLSSFKSTLTTLQGYYPNKKVCLMEYSYAWTTEWAYVASTTGDRAGDGGGVMNNSFWTTEETYAGYEASETGMAQCIYDIHQVLADVGAVGSFYWEPAWIAVDGSSWASNYSSSYYTLNGKTESGFDTCTWANQAFFNYSHKAISSLKVYNYMLEN